MLVISSLANILLGNGVIGNTSGFGPEESGFEPLFPSQSLLPDPLTGRRADFESENAGSIPARASNFMARSSKWPRNPPFQGVQCEFESRPGYQHVCCISALWLCQKMRHIAQGTALGRWCTLVLAFDTFNIEKGVRFPHALPIRRLRNGSVLQGLKTSSKCRDTRERPTKNLWSHGLDGLGRCPLKAEDAGFKSRWLYQHQQGVL